MSAASSPALRAYTHIEAPTSISSAGTNRQTVVFRVPLDAHISASEAYLDVPLLTKAGRPAAPLYAGVQGVVDRAEASLGGTSLRTVRRYGHRVQILQAVGGGSTMTDSLAANHGSGGAPTHCYTPAIDTRTATGGVIYGDVPNLTDAGSYARMTSHSGNATRVITAANGALTNVADVANTWRDQNGLNACTADPTTTTRGLVRLSRIFPELASMPMGLLPRLSGQTLTISLTFDGSWCQDLDLGTVTAAGGAYALAQVSDDIRFVSRRFEFDSKTSDAIEQVFLGYSTTYWESRLSEQGIPAVAAAAGSQTQQSFDLGFQGERVGRVLLARSATISPTFTADAVRLTSELRANPLGRTDTRMQLRCNDRSLFNRPLRGAERWAETAAALDLARLRPPIGSGDRMTPLVTSVQSEAGRLVYDFQTYIPVANKLLSMFAPVAFDTRVDRSQPRIPQNGMESGRAGLVLDVTRISQNSPVVDGDATLYCWAEVGNVLSFSKGAAGMRVEVNPLA